MMSDWMWKTSNVFLYKLYVVAIDLDVINDAFSLSMPPYFLIFSHFHLHLSPLSLRSSSLYLLLTFDLITWFPPPIGLPASSCHAPCSLFPSLYFYLRAYPFIPDLLHPLQSSSVPHRRTGERKGEFSQVVCSQSVGESVRGKRERDKGSRADLSIVEHKKLLQRATEAEKPKKRKDHILFGKVSDFGSLW